MDILNLIPESRTAYRKYADDVYSCGIGILRITNCGDQINALPVSYTFSYILSGELEYTDHHGVTVTLSAGSVFQRQPGLCHTTRIKSKILIEAFIELDKSYYETLSANEFPLCRTPHFHAGLHRDYINRFIHLMERMQQTADNDIQTVIARMICLICDIYSNSRRSQLGNIRHQAAIEKIIELTADDTRLIEDWHSLAEMSDLAPDTFRKAFREITGQSPNAF